MALDRVGVGTSWLVAVLMGATSIACTFDNGGTSFDGGADAETDDGGRRADATVDARPKVSDEVLDGLAAATLVGEVNARAWARTSSAPEVFVTAILPIQQADKNQTDGEVCPVIAENGNTRTYTGGCTSSTAEAWFGSATVTGPKVNGIPLSVTYDHFGHTGTTTCNTVVFATETRYTGTLLRGSALPLLPVDVDLKLGVKRPTTACVLETAAVGFDYHMTIETGPDGNNDMTPDTRTWNGSGRAGKQSGENAGLMSATTASEVTGQACGSEALSGTTTLSAGGHTVVITYDGASDCSNMSTVQWSFDGVAQAAMTGVLCAIAAPGRRAGGAAGSTTLVLLGAFVLFRSVRRRQR